jgi:hypothetical protein
MQEEFNRTDGKKQLVKGVITPPSSILLVDISVLSKIY